MSRKNKKKKILNKKNKSSNVAKIQKIKKENRNKKILIIIALIQALLIIGLVILIYKIDNYNTQLKFTIDDLKKEEPVYLFLGDSITNQYSLEYYYPNLKTINSGINGNTTEHIIEDMKNRVFQHNPTDVFILIGINQIENDSVEKIVDDIIKITEEISKHDQEINIYIQSIYPVNSQIENSLSVHKDNKKIIEINNKLKEFSEKNNIKYIDIYESLIDEDGNLNPIYTQDGLHLNKQAYEIITDKVMEVIY